MVSTDCHFISECNFHATATISRQVSGTVCAWLRRSKIMLFGVIFITSGARDTSSMNANLIISFASVRQHSSLQTPVAHLWRAVNHVLNNAEHGHDRMNEKLQCHHAKYDFSNSCALDVFISHQMLNARLYVNRWCKFHHIQLHKQTYSLPSLNIQFMRERKMFNNNWYNEYTLTD